jgi:hypothetical protein
MTAADATARARLPIVADAPPPFVPRFTGAFEPAAESDVLHDYILEPYEPKASQAGKLRGLALLYETFAIAGVEKEGLALVTRVRDTLGPFRTVWGVKHDRERGELRGWELYFYDWKRVHADLSIASLKEILAPVVKLDVELRRDVPWHMVSIEVSPADLKDPSRSVAAHLYVDMRSYEAKDKELLFENVYTFHDPRLEIDDVMNRLKASLHFDFAKDRLAELLPPRLFRCHKMCVANKRTGDALYFSRVDTDALRQFLRAQNYPKEIVGLADAEAKRLDHLLWDVGVDFAARDTGLTVRRTGFYGSF